MKNIIAVLLALIVGFAGGMLYSGNYVDDDEDTYDFEIIKEEVKEISELAVLQETYTSTVPYTSASKKLWKTDIEIPYSQKSMVAEYKATIKMGPKLDDDNFDVQGEGSAISVTLPHSQVLSHEIDEESWTLKDKKNGWFNPLTPDDDSKLRKLAKKNALETQDIEGMLAEADESAGEQITSFLKTAYPDADVTIDFK